MHPIRIKLRNPSIHLLTFADKRGQMANLENANWPLNAWQILSRMTRMYRLIP